MDKPRADLKPNTFAYENQPLVAASGFREYDARWLLGPDVNLAGITALGLGLGTLLAQMGVPLKVVSGHDFRSYSLAVKQALMLGLMRAGCTVHDIGLALSPMAYFAQFALDCPAVAMVTASHNENGWTGVKMGAERPLTFGPDEMTRLKDIVLGGLWQERPGGACVAVPDMRETYLADVTKGIHLSRPIKVVAATGNGTAGAFAPEALRRIGADVVPMDNELDHSFPKYNPNPEDLHMLHAMGEMVRTHGADLALGFDGDGDRCGVVDDRGREIFADKIGVLLARDLAVLHPRPQFVVDVKSTGLYHTDPVLIERGVQVDYWKTGHSYIKRRTSELKALAGFEKSGHFFFNAPAGRGYDDGIVAGIAVLQMLDRAGGKKLSALYDGLPETFGSPTMSPFCPDDKKYAVVEALTAQYQALVDKGAQLLGQKIASIVTVNGVRVTLEDGTWGLVRASSNKPSLVVVVESPVSEAQKQAIFADIDARLSAFPEVGAYDQKI